jgi:hypothetical protein
MLFFKAMFPDVAAPAKPAFQWTEVARALLG